MSNFVKTMAVLGMIVLAALIVDFGHVLVSLIASSSFTMDGVKGSGDMFPLWLPWQRIAFYAGVVLLILTPIVFFAIRGLEKRMSELEAKHKTQGQ